MTSSLESLLAAQASARRSTGWGGFPVAKRDLDGPEPWDYEARARDLILESRCTVDLGTGGGEVFSRIAVAAGGRLVASEEWHVNAKVAGKRLAAVGIPVLHASSLATPLRSGSFDLVLSRHEAIDPPEVDRILAPAGTFLTQQMAPEHWPELRRFLPRQAVFADHWLGYQAWFREHGYDVEARRFDYRTAFGSLADLVYMLAVAPWEVPDFDVERDFAALLAIEAALTGPVGIVLSEGKYLLEARKPADR
jgi:SAM-dependent methyltransferase